MPPYFCCLISEKDANRIDITCEIEEKVIKSLETKISPGIDSITNEVIKYEGKILIQELTLLYNSKLDTGEVPTE